MKTGGLFPQNTTGNRVAETNANKKIIGNRQISSSTGGSSSDLLDRDGVQAEIATGAPPDPHALGGSAHTSDTLANLNSKITDATLDDASDTREPDVHDLSGVHHNTSTVLAFNAMISNGDFIQDSDVTYGNLNANGDVGTGSTQVARGNDSRFPTQSENDALQGTDGTPSSTNRYVTDSDSRISGARIINTELIQGSVDDASDAAPGYIDSTDIAEDSASSGPGTIYYSELSSGAGGTSLNWSSVLPIVKPTGANQTHIEMWSLFTDTTGSTDENNTYGNIVIDWENNRINGYIMTCQGKGYSHFACYRFTGTIGAGTNDYTGVKQNGTDSPGSDPTFRIDGTNEEIDRLPMPGKFRNVSFKITHYS